MRVLHLVLSLDTGGLERVVLDLLRGTDRRRCDPAVLCLRQPGTLATEVTALGLMVSALQSERPLVALPRLIRVLRRLRPDVVHSHNAGPLVLASLAQPLARFPVLVQTRHFHEVGHGLPLKAALRWAARRCGAYVTVSQAGAAQALLEGVPPRRLQVIHNGVDVSRFAPPTRSLPTRGLKAISVSRLSLVKDPETLLKAAARIAAARPDFRLELVGGGPDRAAFENFVHRFGLESTVAFLGEHADVRPLLAGADLFMLGSRSEGISIAVLEAMAMGLPVVATDVGGNGEIVRDGVTGRLVPARDPEALAEAVLRLLEDPAARLAMGTASRRRVEEAFDLRRTVEAYQEIYESHLQLTSPIEPPRPRTERPPSGPRSRTS